MTTERDRVICVSLTDAEWQAFVARQPQPVDWLRQQILNQLTPAATETSAPSSAMADARGADAGPTRAAS